MFSTAFWSCVIKLPAKIGNSVAIVDVGTAGEANAVHRRLVRCHGDMEVESVQELFKSRAGVTFDCLHRPQVAKV